MKNNIHEFGRSNEMNTHVENSRKIICQEALKVACELKACFVTTWQGYSAYMLILMDIVLN